MAIAKVELKCSVCGETYTAEKKCYNRTEANNWESYMSGRDGTCRECYGKMMAAKREQGKAEEAAKVAEAVTKCPLSLPELIGSEKQVKWANDLRNRLIAQMSIRGIKWNIIANREFPEAHKDELNANADKLLESSAKAWIDMRGTEIFGIRVD